VKEPGDPEEDLQVEEDPRLERRASRRDLGGAVRRDKDLLFHDVLHEKLPFEAR
jgi:hypothetical protein